MVLYSCFGITVALTNISISYAKLNNMIPDPYVHNRALQEHAFAMAKSRVPKPNLVNREDAGELGALMEDEFKDNYLNMPNEILRKNIRSSMPPYKIAHR